MARLPPEELWHKHLLERYYAFKLTSDWRLLRKEGLRILSRRALLTAEEWTATFHERASSKEYHAWYEKCTIEGQRFGLTPWVVAWTCLLKDYKPEDQPHEIGSQWPLVRVITESTDSQFLAWLTYHARKLGLYVIQHQGSVEATQVFINPRPMSEMPAPPTPTSLPPLPDAFRMRVDVPVGYPPKAAGQMQKDAGLLAKRLLMSLGYPPFQRLRPSSLIEIAEVLDVQKQRLPRRRLYEIVATTAPEKDLEGDLTNISVAKDRKRTRVLKSRKYQIRKRLVKPHDSHAKTTDS